MRTSTQLSLLIAIACACPAHAEPVSFKKDIATILAKSCLECLCRIRRTPKSVVSN